jgi:nicotinamide riboside kinase
MSASAPPSAGVAAATRAIRVGISGASSVGKATLAQRLQDRLRSTRFNVGQVSLIHHVGREMIRPGRTHDDMTAFDDYAAYFQRHLRNLSGQPVGCTIYVRTVFDALAYAEVNGNLTGVWMEMAHEIALLGAEKFHVYFYVPIEPHVPFVPNEYRNTDPAYRGRIDKFIRKVLEEFVPGFVELRGTLEQRLAAATAAVEAPLRRASV